MISGATEKERASLARTLSPTKLSRARGEKAALAAYAVGALTSSAPRAMRIISELFHPLRDENFNIIPEPPMPATEQLWEFLTQGVIERSDEWVLHFVEECSDDWSIRSWTHLNKLMREHSLTSLSPGVSLHDDECRTTREGKVCGRVSEYRAVLPSRSCAAGTRILGCFHS